jgi:signal transduction histidine kinase
LGITDNLFLDFSIAALSILNGILLLWLGLTVVLNAQTRSWGLWLAGAGLLLGSVFFILHSTILSNFQDLFHINNMIWWPAAWMMVIFLPLAWYVDILWYTGFWNLKETEHSKLQNARKIHKAGVIILTCLLGIMAVILLLSEPFKTFLQGQRLYIFSVLSYSSIHEFFWIYAFFIVLCMALSIYALSVPVPSGRLMGDEARKRALPYFLGATISLFLVTFVVIIIFFWVESQMRTIYYWRDSLNAIAIFDVIINFLILSSVLFIGQAVCSYEVYTGETLPRKGLMRHWQRVITLGLGFSFFAALALIFSIRTIFIILFMAVLIIVFFAFMTWRLFMERERFMDQLRPFVNSQQLYRQTVKPDGGNISQAIGGEQIDETLASIFVHLCQEILGTSYAVVAADTGLLSIRDFFLVYPRKEDQGFKFTPVNQAQNATLDQSNLITPFSQQENHNIRWSVPLWGEVGRIGTLFLGEKTDNSLYTHEEIEIARAACERLLDTKASTEMTRQLMALQREQLTNSQLLDQHARQLLHDEILPDLQALMINLDNPKGGEVQKSELMLSLQALHKRLSDLLYSLPATFSPEISRDRLIDAIKKLPELKSANHFSKIQWMTDEKAIQQFEQLPIQIREILYFALREAIRNAAQHGGKNGFDVSHILEISLSSGTYLEISVKDYGGGVDVDRFTGNHDQRSGKGLSIHQTMLAIIGGSLTVESIPGQFTKVTMRVPLR